MTVTRFAPSPTGYLHVGNLRTALFNHLIAKKAGGTFVLRLDDTDPERSKQEYADAIQEDLEWLGITWDRLERQSERLDRYAAAADELREKGRFYEAFETPTELDLKRKKQLNMGLPPVYDRAALDLSEAEKEGAARRAGSGCLALQAGPGADRVAGRHPRRSVDRRGQRLGPGPDPRGWAGALYPRLGRGRHGHGHHPCRARLRPRDQHRDADPDHPGAGRHAAGLRASFASDRAAGRGAVEAPGHVVPARSARGGGGAHGASEPDGADRVVAAGGRWRGRSTSWPRGST
jgi:hypothetical protein